MKQQHFQRTLALYVTRRGIAFTFFTSPNTLHDWGTKEVRGTDKHADTLQHAQTLISRFQPDLLVIEDAESKGSRRAPRIRTLYRAILRSSVCKTVTVETYSREDIRKVFETVESTTKHEINCAIVRLIPALLSRQPPKRKFSGETEPAAQGIFDAATLACTSFVKHKQLDIQSTVHYSA